MPDVNTRIVVKRPNGKVEVIGRKGQHSPNDVARRFAEKGLGTVMTVRHEMSVPIDSNVRTSKAQAAPRRTTTVAIHQVKR